jgi:hypothetical protein
MPDKAEVRAALWKNLPLIDAYCDSNPHGLSAAELDIVRSWKRSVTGKFVLLRYLKKYTILVSEGRQVYGVLGLRSTLEDMFPGRPLPLLVEAVLLPFKGSIIHDGLLKDFGLTFGPGIRSEMNEDYLAAKQNGRIITTLEPQAVHEAPFRRQKRRDDDPGPAIEEMVKTCERLRGGTAIQNAALALLRAGAKAARTALLLPEDLDELWHLGHDAHKALRRLHSALGRAER